MLVEIAAHVLSLHASCVPGFLVALACQIVAVVVMLLESDALSCCQGLKLKIAHCCSLNSFCQSCTYPASRGRVVRPSSSEPARRQGVGQAFGRSRTVRMRASGRPTDAYCGAEGTSLLGRLTNPYRMDNTQVRTPA